MASKETREIYRGKAIIMNVAFEGVEDWKDWEKRDLNEADCSSAFKIVYNVAEGNANGTRHDVKLECSHRELKGSILGYYTREDGSTPTQMDFTLRTLVQQGILPRGAKECDIVSAADDDAVCGREVTIRAFEELSKDGVTWWPRCTFSSAKTLITGADKAARIAAFLAGKPAPRPSAASASPAPSSRPLPPAPDDSTDPDDLPF